MLLVTSTPCVAQSAPPCNLKNTHPAAATPTLHSPHPAQPLPCNPYPATPIGQLPCDPCDPVQSTLMSQLHGQCKSAASAVRGGNGRCLFKTKLKQKCSAHECWHGFPASLLAGDHSELNMKLFTCTLNNACAQACTLHNKAYGCACPAACKTSA